MPKARPEAQQCTTNASRAHTPTLMAISDCMYRSDGFFSFVERSCLSIFALTDKFSSRLDFFHKGLECDDGLTFCSRWPKTLASRFVQPISFTSTLSTKTGENQQKKITLIQAHPHQYLPPEVQGESETKTSSSSTRSLSIHCFYFIEPGNLLTSPFQGSKPSQAVWLPTLPAQTSISGFCFPLCSRVPSFSQGVHDRGSIQSPSFDRGLGADMKGSSLFTSSLKNKHSHPSTSSQLFSFWVSRGVDKIIPAEGTSPFSFPNGKKT
jgi:hypothetical protein